MNGKCEEIKVLLTDYALSESSKQDALAVEGHVAHCVTCRAELNDVRGMLGLLQTAEVQHELPRSVRVVEPSHTERARAGFWGSLGFWASLKMNAGRMTLTGGALACLAVGLLGLFQARITYGSGEWAISFGNAQASMPAATPVPAPGSMPGAMSTMLPVAASESAAAKLTKADVEAMVIAAIQASELRQRSAVSGLVRDASLKAEERRNADVQQMAETFRYMQAAQTNLWKEQVQSQQIVVALAQKNGLNLSE